MPTFPAVETKSVEVPERVFVPLKYGNCPVVPVKSEEVAILSVSDVPPTNEPIVPELERPRPSESDEVPTLVRPLVPLPYKSCEDVNVLCPVPPFATLSADARVRTPALEKLEVAVAPK